MTKKEELIKSDLKVVRELREVDAFITEITTVKKYAKLLQNLENSHNTFWYLYDIIEPIDKKKHDVKQLLKMIYNDYKKNTYDWVYMWITGVVGIQDCTTQKPTVWGYEDTEEKQEDGSYIYNVYFDRLIRLVKNNKTLYEATYNNSSDDVKQCKFVCKNFQKKYFEEFKEMDSLAFTEEFTEYLIQQTDTNHIYGYEFALPTTHIIASVIEAVNDFWKDDETEEIVEIRFAKEYFATVVQAKKFIKKQTNIIDKAKEALKDAQQLIRNKSVETIFDAKMINKIVNYSETKKQINETKLIKQMLLDKSIFDSFDSEYSGFYLFHHMLYHHSDGIVKEAEYLRAKSRRKNGGLLV
tara:strand:+ start:786 stop:1847 length:1062 start_codon:yes stop_codon:yes gene_type:complete